jgi:hypothetical protein
LKQLTWIDWCRPVACNGVNLRHLNPLRS